MHNQRHSDGPSRLKIIHFPHNAVQRALAFKRKTGRVNEDDTAEERSYIRHLLHQGLSAVEVSSKLQAPIAFVNTVRISGTYETGPRNEPPPGYISKMPSRYSDIDSAAHAKWFLKHGLTPEVVSKMIGKPEQWIYGLISGRIHAQVTPRSPDEAREVLEAHPFAAKTQKPQKTTSWAEIEAGYILWLGQRYPARVIAAATKCSIYRTRQIISGYTLGHITPVEPPEGFYDRDVLAAGLAMLSSRTDNSARKKKTAEWREQLRQHAAWLRWLAAKGHTSGEIVKMTGLEYAYVYRAVANKVAFGVLPEEPPHEFYSRVSLQR